MNDIQDMLVTLATESVMQLSGVRPSVCPLSVCSVGILTVTHQEAACEWCDAASVHFSLTIKKTDILVTKPCVKVNWNHRTNDAIEQLLIIILCWFCVYVLTESSAASCGKSLGMHSGAIPDEAITASSSYDSVSVGPAFGRYICLVSLSAFNFLSQPNYSTIWLWKSHIGLR